MSTALATISSGQSINPLSDVIDVVKHMDELWHLAQILVKSAMLPKSIKTPEAAVAIMLKGRELGIGAMHAFASITVIQGNPGASPQLMLALINRSGLCEELEIWDDGEAAFVKMKRRGRSAHTERFGMDDADIFLAIEWTDGNKREIRLSQKHNWKSQPKIMRKWRAVAACARIVFPDVIAGMYTPEELGADVNEDGEIIEGEIVSAHKPGPKFADNGSGHGVGSYGTPAQVKASRKLIAEIGKQESEKWVDAWVSSNRALPNGLSEFPFQSATIARIVLMAATSQGKLEPVEMAEDPSTGEAVPRASIDQTHQLIAVVADREPQWFEATLRGAFSLEMCRIANAFVAENPSYSIPPEYEVVGEEASPEDESQDPEPPPPPAAPKRMSKKELADAVLARIKAEKLAAEQANVPDRGDAHEGDESTAGE